MEEKSTIRLTFQRPGWLLVSSPWLYVRQLTGFHLTASCSPGVQSEPRKMGNSNSFSQEVYDSYSLGLYETTLQHPCLLPDIGIDNAMLSYSGTDSNAVLKAYSDDMIHALPGIIRNLGSGLRSFKSVPNAVGIGALVIAMIFEIALKLDSNPSTPEDAYDMMHRVFGEEKASAVRDTMSEYLKRHRMYLKNSRVLLQELSTLEHRLSGELTTLKNSMLNDQQLTDRGLKIWVNGAAFHVQMLIHGARLNSQLRGSQIYNAAAVEAAISSYQVDLDNSLETLKTRMSKAFTLTWDPRLCIPYKGCGDPHCNIRNGDRNCRFAPHHWFKTDPCEQDDLKKAYMNQIFSRYEPIVGSKRYFSHTKENLDTLIRQSDSFTVPSAPTYQFTSVG